MSAQAGNRLLNPKFGHSPEIASCIRIPNLIRNPPTE